jgi:hypothetical protein
MAVQKHRDSLIWGLILIIGGGILLLEINNVHIWNYLWKFWPVVFILWGASKLYYGIKERDKAAQDKGHEI